MEKLFEDDGNEEQTQISQISIFFDFSKNPKTNKMNPFENLLKTLVDRGNFCSRNLLQKLKAMGYL